MPLASTELAKLFPLESLRPETREQLGLEATVSDYGRGETIFRAGDM